MLYFLGLIPLLAVAIGCQAKPEEPPSSRPIKSKPEDPPGTPYDRACLARPDCDGSALQAAAMDYVGAVYGKPGLARFDGILRENEHRAVASEFGELQRRGDLSDYFGSAREKFLSAHKNPNRGVLCKDASRFSSMTLAHPRWGEARALGGLHDCGSVFGNLYVQGGLELLIASRPQDWVFFIERSEHEDTPERLEENALFHRIAQALEIPVHNPVVSILSDEVIGRLEAKHRVRRIDVAVSFTLGRIHDQLFNDPNLAHLNGDQLQAYEYETVRRIFFNGRSAPEERAALRIYAERLQVTHSELWKECKRMVQGSSRDTPRAYAERRASQIGRLRPLLAGISNELSAEQVRGFLEKEKRPKAFFQVGQAHLPIVEGIYKSKSGK